MPLTLGDTQIRCLMEMLQFRPRYLLFALKILFKCELLYYHLLLLPD